MDVQLASPTDIVNDHMSLDIFPDSYKDRQTKIRIAILTNETVAANMNTNSLGLSLHMPTGLGFAHTTQWLLEAGATIASKLWDTVCAALSIAIR